MPALYGAGLYGLGLYGSGPPRVLAIAFSPLVQPVNALFAGAVQHINALFANPMQPITAVFSEVVMTTPYTTIDSSATVTDQYGVLISNIPTVTLTVTFPDRSTSTPIVTNTGGGVYTATYATKGPGVLTETWNFTDVSGAVAQEQRILIIS